MDTISPEKRSEIMSSVRSKNTRPELRVRKYLCFHGIRYRVHIKDLPGSPDIVLQKYKAVIFVHGCFWHGHQGCRKSRLPTTRSSFWMDKRKANLERDARKISELIQLGWRVAVVWQCVLEKPEIFSYIMNNLERWIISNNTYFEIPNRIETTQNQ